MIVGILREPEIEARVSLLPEAVATLTKKGINVIVESDAGTRASASNADYEKAGGKISSAQEVISSSDVILAIHHPNGQLAIPNSKILIGVYQPLYNQPLMQDWAQKGF